MNELPPELRAMNEAMNMIFDTLVKPKEDRLAMITRWEREGRLDPNCPGCREFYDSPKLPIDVFAPSHKASNGCESGKRPHCTCDTCF
jgi:hypothetical protein